MSNAALRVMLGDMGERGGWHRLGYDMRALSRFLGRVGSCNAAIGTFPLFAVK